MPVIAESAQRSRHRKRWPTLAALMCVPLLLIGAVMALPWLRPIRYQNLSAITSAKHRVIAAIAERTTTHPQDTTGIPRGFHYLVPYPGLYVVSLRFGDCLYGVAWM